MTDVLKDKQPGSWKQDSTNTNQFADSFLKFDIDSVSHETFTKAKVLNEQGWCTFENLKNSLPSALFTWVNEISKYGAMVEKVK